MTEFPEATELDQWLVDQHHDFVQGLTAQLDLDAGLREVQLTDRHTGLVDGLSGQLDIEAGLAAILPTAPKAPALTGGLWREGSPQWAAGELVAMPLPNRLWIRAAYAHKLGAAARLALRLSTAGPEDIPHLPKTGLPDDRLQIFRREFSTAFELPGHKETGGSDPRILSIRFKRSDTNPEDPQGTLFEIPGAERRRMMGELDRNPPYADARLLDYLAAAEQAAPEISETDAAAARWREDSERAISGVDVTHLAGYNIRVGHVEGGQRDEEEGSDTDENATESSEHWYPAWRLNQIRRDNSAFGAQWIEVIRAYVQQLLGREEQAAESDQERSPRITQALTAIADDLEDLAQMLNDFTDADLREVELDGVPLEGLRWSAVTTRWPDGWREQIELISILVDDNIYEVHYGTHATQTSLV